MQIRPAFPHDDFPNLGHLIRLGLGTAGLQVQDLGDRGMAENMVIASDAFFKPPMFQQPYNIIESEIAIGGTTQQPQQDLFE